MNRFIKIAVFWLLIFALPVQGFAAATMRLCDHDIPSRTIAHGSASQIAAHSHQYHHEHIQGADLTDSSNTANTHHHINHSTQCKGGCCTTSLITATILSDPRRPLTVGLRLVPSEPQLISRFIPDGLERPPRSSQV
jgi:hypothetical protein